ncbi:hypothetical protein RD110_07215 [Rhodoferax koreense]|uniref:Uncharacterized protein n=1 Tax=Rhodoferax koreensis TaxID=1842727 RepID=A0A1P8JTD9_9BURK|nr:hypothetical protein [Rhodoferax koreense]APW37016.1 hypothetical protein RD110_07215 [Rhodoferax koreense]
MKAIFLTLALSALLPGLALAQADAPAKKTTPATKAAAKAEPKAKAQPKKVVAKKEPPSKSRVELKSAAKNVAAGIEAAEAALTPAELAIAQRIEVGTMPCELGNSVTVVADPKNPGYFDMTMKNLKYRMSPVATTTGAIRLEDQKAGAVWLQLANKSMLMNHKLGQRLADECMSPSQVVVAEAIRKNPPPSVLDAVPPANK